MIWQEPTTRRRAAGVPVRIATPHARRPGGLLFAVEARKPMAQTSAPARSRPLVVLVRHADKAADPDDPPLAPAGVERAKELAQALRHAGVTAIITTQYRRARATAQPLADMLRISPEVIAVDVNDLGKHVGAVVDRVRAEADGVVLVVGHDVTIPAIIAALGGPQLPDICADRFGNLFVVATDGTTAQVIHAHYGAAGPAPGPDCM